MTKSWRMPEGSSYVYELQNSNSFALSPDERWEIVVYQPTGDEEHLGFRSIDDARVAVFRCGDGVYRALLSQNCRRISTEDES